MIDLQNYLGSKLRTIFSSWNEEGLYAISFYVSANELCKYKGYSNVPEFFVSYNTEADCDGADMLSEERWNYAFWCQDEIPVIEADEKNEGIKVLFDWYAEKGIENIGDEDDENCYDEQMRYIGKGPIGYYELFLEIAAVAKKLQESGFVKEKFGTPIPIIIHDLDYSWYAMEATREANPNGEADVFLAAMKALGIVEE